MAKINKPLFSLSAIGALGKHLVFRKQGKGTVAQQRTIAKDARTAGQLQWRIMYQKAVALWHLLSPSEKAAWERQATPLHMIGFAYFISQALKPNPGIYLPLSGGAMSGNIDMATNKIPNLPAPISDEEPIRKVDLATHAALETAVHGLVGFNAFHVRLSSTQSIPPSTVTVIQCNSEIYDYGSHWTSASYRLQPSLASTWFICFLTQILGLVSGTHCDVYFFKNGSVHTYGDRYVAYGSSNPWQPSSCLCQFNGSTDYLDVRILHSNTSSLNLPASNYRNIIMGFLISQS